METVKLGRDDGVKVLARRLACKATEACEFLRECSAVSATCIATHLAMSRASVVSWALRSASARSACTSSP